MRVVRRPACGWFVPIGLAVLMALPAPAQRSPELPPDDVQRAEQLREDLRQMVALARDRVFPALVNINVITVQYWGGQERKGRSVGSGTIISEEGHVLTNYHVARNGRKFIVTLADKQEITATLVGEDPLTDLAVLKLDVSELRDTGAPLPVARFGDSDDLEIGDTVMAMGSPWALSRSVTMGIVANTERVLAASDDDVGEMRFDADQRTGIFNRWIQHDAAINPGNSGGPLVNLKGEIVGVNTRGNVMGGDMGFAIPANIARTVAAALIESGEVTRSAYGFSLRPTKRTGRETGVLVNSVESDGPAEHAGLRAGDVILEIDGEPVTAFYPEEIPPLLKALADRPVGKPVRFTCEREGRRYEAELTTVRLERDAGDQAAFRGWGLSAQAITHRMAYERRLDGMAGVLISGVRPGSPAQTAEPPIEGGDVIRRVGDDAVATLEDFVAAYERIMSDRDDLPEFLVVEFDRAGRRLVTLLKPRPDEEVPPPREVPKAWVGVAVQPVIPRLARELGHEDKTGFRVTRVYPGTLAVSDGLRVGDVILSLNGDRLRPRGMQDADMFHRQVRRLDVDGRAKLLILRDGEDVELDVALERTRLTSGEAERERNRDFDLTVREVTFFDRDDNRWDESVQGVIVAQVESAGWAGIGGLRPGDLIRRIDREEIRGLADFRRVMNAIADAQPERVEFVVLRGVRTQFQYVEPEWKPRIGDDPPEDKETP